MASLNRSGCKEPKCQKSRLKQAPLTHAGGRVSLIESASSSTAQEAGIPQLFGRMSLFNSVRSEDHNPPAPYAHCVGLFVLCFCPPLPLAACGLRPCVMQLRPYAQNSDSECLLPKISDITYQHAHCVSTARTQPRRAVGAMGK